MVAPTSAQDDSGVVAIGTVLADRYRIESVLGSGGMGRVYRGEHIGIGRPVAVKVLHARLGNNEEAAIRFQREALASGRLDHPNIVGTLDFGTLDNGCLYLVMEALEGEHLGQRLARDGRIPWQEALAIMRAVLLGLRHAHDRGVIHRDIKPDNIFLATKDGEAIVKILDFGIAKLYVGMTDGDQQATRAGITVGTPKYLSPEQAVGGAITPACDVYSASVVLYEMLAGRAPFDSDDPLTLLTSHAGSDVPAFRDVAPDLDVPAELEDLVRQGLAKFAAERVPSALEYVQRIDEILHAHGVATQPAPRPPRASQSMGIPAGPFTTPLPRTASLTPSPGFLATPMPFPVVETPPPVAPRASAPRVRGATVERTDVTRRPQRGSRARIAIGALVLVAVAGVAAAFVYTRGERAGAEATATAATDPHPAPPAPPPPAIDHDAQLAAALHALEAGATCADRKKALDTLVGLGDAKAVPAIRRARVRKVNACLRATADQALRTLAN